MQEATLGRIFMRKVITYGTFDLFHRGHYNILKRAKEQGDYLIVGVTGESYDIERGKLNVRDSLTKRIENVKNTGFVDEVIIEEYLGQKIRDIAKHDVDVFVIGSDWAGKFDHLRKYCEVVYLERTKNISSTELREKTDDIVKIGIVTDAHDDERVTEEAKHVSGYHIAGVYFASSGVPDELRSKHQPEETFESYDAMLDEVDLVSIHVAPESRYEYVLRALNAGKHVICASPLVGSAEKCEELFELAKKKNTVLMEDMTTVYLRAFTQLLWMAQGDVVGNTLAVKCAVSCENAEAKYGSSEWIALCITMIIKILGPDYESLNVNYISTEGDEGGVATEGITDGNTDVASAARYEKLTFGYENALGTVEVTKGIEITNHLTIVGDRATITVRDDWWNTGYFEVKNKDSKFPRKCSFNFEGNGFRYVLQEMLIMLRDGRTECTRLFPEESVRVAEIMEEVKDKYEEM